LGWEAIQIALRALALEKALAMIADSASANM